MSSVTPGRETDAAVAEALGLHVFAANIRDGMESGAGHYSTEPADALAALEATGKPYSIIKGPNGIFGCSIGWGRVTVCEEPSLCIAACRAILAWADSKTAAESAAQHAGEAKGGE